MTRLGKSACDSAGYEFCVEFENKIKRYAVQTGMLSGCRRILAALSGGPDSVALLSVLCAWHKAGGDAFAIEAVHVNHGIRGEDVMTMRSEKYLKACIDEYVSLIETHRSLLEILLFRAQGSSLEHFRESYTDRSTGLVKAWFAAMKKKYPNINTAVSDFIIHLHTVWMFTLFEELLMHAVPKQEMESILHDYILFEIQGWRAIIKV